MGQLLIDYAHLLLADDTICRPWHQDESIGPSENDDQIARLELHDLDIDGMIHVAIHYTIHDALILPQNRRFRAYSLGERQGVCK